LEQSASRGYGEDCYLPAHDANTVIWATSQSDCKSITLLSSGISAVSEGHTSSSTTATYSYTAKIECDSTGRKLTVYTEIMSEQVAEVVIQGNFYSVGKPYDEAQERSVMSDMAERALAFVSQ
jgi:hypothetical protein